MNRIARLRALLTIAVVATLSAVAFAAPAEARSAPRPTSDAEISRIIAAAAAQLPHPGTPESAALNAKRTTFALPGGRSQGGNRAAQAVVLCTAFSEVLQARADGFVRNIGTATSTCPAPVSYLSARAELYLYSPDLQRYIFITAGSLGLAVPYGSPGEPVTSTASTSCAGATFAVIGYHEARIGTAVATATTSSTRVLFSCG
jgi:hypothetical protein